MPRRTLLEPGNEEKVKNPDNFFENGISIINTEGYYDIHFHKYDSNKEDVNFSQFNLGTGGSDHRGYF